jgi:anti-sigma factor RsiW
MPSPSTTQQLLLRYLLGELSSAERERIDESLITDQDFSDAFAEARNELLDAYASGTLSPEWQQNVRKAFLNTPEAAAALEVAAALQKKRTKMARRFPFRAGLATLLPALAACLVLAFWLRSSLSSRSDRHGLSAPGPSPVAAVKPLEPAPAKADESAGKPAMSAALQPITLALVMPAGTLRGSEALALRLSPATERVQVQWPLPAEEADAAYILLLSRGAASAKRFAQHGPLKTIDGVKVASFLVPAASLADGEWNFVLQAAQTENSVPVAQSWVAVSRR